MSDICIGPNGGCPQCYHDPCRCNESAEARQARERLQKREKAQERVVNLLDCDSCDNGAVVADDVVRAYVCLRCGVQQKPRWTPIEQSSSTGSSPTQKKR